MMVIDVQSEAVQAYLLRLQARLGDLSAPMAGIGEEIITRISGRFETERDPSGLPWAPWAPVTRANYPAGGHHRILNRSGDMLGSIGSEVTPTSVRVGFGQPYAYYHEHGAPARNLPRRGIIFDDPKAGKLAADDENKVINILQDWLSRT